MNVFNSFKSFFTNPNSFEWIDFLQQYAVELFNLNEIKKFLDQYPFIGFQSEDLPSLFKETLVHELYFWPYQESFTNKTSLCDGIIVSTKNILSNLISAHRTFEQPSLLLDEEDSISIGQEFIDQHREFYKLIKEDELELLHSNSFDTRLKDLILNWSDSSKYSSYGVNITNSKIEEQKLVEEIRPTIIHSIDLIDISTYKLLSSNPELLKTLNWRVSEELLADILKTFNYQIELTQATKDGGIDIIAIKQDTDFGVHKYLLQAKRYSNNVGIEPVQRLLYHHQDQKPSKVCLATTANFTKGAWELAKKYCWQLELKDMQGILGWINKVVDLRSNKDFKTL